MKKLIKLLKNKNLSITFAESMTGGLLSSSLTKYAGVSAIFKGSIIAYSINVKEDVLKVKSEIIKSYSIVSKEVSEAMIAGLKDIVDANIYVAITGNAGPKIQENTSKFNAFYTISINDKNYTYEVIFNNGKRLKNNKKVIREITNKLLLLLNEEEC